MAREQEPDTSDADSSSDTSDADTSDADTSSETSDADTSSDTSDADTIDSSDLGPPYLFADQYSQDSGMNPPWSTLVDRPEFYGVILKAWQGKSFNDGGWFAHNWPAVRHAGGARSGTSWLRGAYLFLDFTIDGAVQTDAYLHAVEAAGGWEAGDILPIVDVEVTDDPKKVNFLGATTKQMIIDCVASAAARLKSETGRRVMLYGRRAMGERQITDKMGCDVAWNPSYTSTMHRAGLEAFALEEIVLWQYCGDNKAVLSGYPSSVPGFGKIDISVFIKGSGTPTLEDVTNALL